MDKQSGGVIVNTASAVANVGVTDRAAYVASKSAVAALTRAMATDHVGAKIRMSAVAPGTIESPNVTKIMSGANGAELRRERLGRSSTETSWMASFKRRAPDEAASPTCGALVPTRRPRERPT